MNRAVEATVFDLMLHAQLLDRRQRLQSASTKVSQGSDFARLLDEVDAALIRFENGTYGLCEECQGPIEPDRLLADPLVRVCLDDLSLRQRQALEADLVLAAEIQRGLLPNKHRAVDRWNVDFVYRPAGVVSGDYVDVIPQNGDLYFILGDVSGKGMAASLLMSSLHAMFQSLVPIGMPVCDLMKRANRLLCESSPANHYATLVLGRATNYGEVEICNAGHLPPIVIGGADHRRIDSAGLPLGMFCEVDFESSVTRLGRGDALLLYSDGVTEAVNAYGEEYGIERLVRSVNGGPNADPADLISNCVAAVDGFRSSASQTDDLTVMAMSFAGAPA